MEEWKEFYLSDLLIDKGYIRGPFGSALRRPELKKSGIPVYEQQHAIYNSRDFRFYIDDLKFNELKRFQVKPDDLIISCSGTVGKISIIHKNDPIGIISQALLILRVNTKKISPQYLYYFLTNPKGNELLLQASHGSVQVNIAPKNIVANIELLLPPLPIQHRIAEILGALDDKIELNRQMNHTLEQMAQALYKHYFVDDIDPVNLPEGWRNGVLGEIFNITMGQSPDGKSYNTDKSGILFFQGRTDFGFRFPEARVYTSEPKRYAKKFDTLVSVRAPVGDINIAYDDCCVGRGLAAVQHKTIKPSFTFYTLKSLRNDFNTFNGEGTVFGSINKDDFNRISITIPLDSTLNAFEGIVKPLDDLIFTNHNEILNLALIRDFLLPRLIIGEITPSDLQTIEQAL